MIVGSSKVNSVAFDYSGIYLAIGGGGNESGQHLSPIYLYHISIHLSTISFPTILYSSLYIYISLNATGSNISVLTVKDWKPVADLSGIHSKAVTSVSWGQHASSLVSCSLDRSIKVFTPTVSNVVDPTVMSTDEK